MQQTVGVDWGSEQHAVCVLDSDGSVLAAFSVPHSAGGLELLLRQLAQFGSPQQLPVAIERPSGLLVETIVAAGHPLVPIHPNVVKASRPRYRSAGGKSDPTDAYILADLLRTDGHRFRLLRPASDQIKALRALSRSRDDLISTRCSLGNQLTALLDSFWPGAVNLFSSIHSPISLAFLDRYPSPKAAKTLTPKRLAAFLSQRSYTGRQKPDTLLDHLRSAPTPLCGDLETEAKALLVRAHVAALRTLTTQLHHLSSLLERAVANLPDGRILMSFPRAGKVNAGLGAGLVRVESTAGAVVEGRAHLLLALSVASASLARP